MSEHLDGIFYINLDKRKDRRVEIEYELKRMNLNAERFSAVEYAPPNGIVGCGKSHLQVIKTAKERGYKNVLVLEDDFIFTVSKQEFEDHLTKILDPSIDFDVCFISYNLLEERESDIPFFKRASFSNTASGYIVKSHYFDAIINLYEWALPLLESTGHHWIYANDQVWRELQEKDKWYCMVPRLGVQSDGFSDNSQKFISRGV
jgi:GR25 family glycosyltransferase involved in LPS biosynthesis